MYTSYIKRIIDVNISIFIIITLIPLHIISVIILYIANSGNIIYSQNRPGLKERIFTIYKYKTLNNNKDTNGNLLPDNKRMTVCGKVFRQLSIDELPQLFNVLKGDMSLIGPRPLLIEYLPLYNEYQRKRHNVKPGITGWAQVNGRNAISWEEKFEYDVWYTENISFSLDMKIFFLTIKKILLKEGISSSTSETMERFVGTK